MELEKKFSEFNDDTRNDYMAKVKTKIELEAKARYFRFIIKLADYYRNGKGELISQILNDEKKSITSDKDKIEIDKIEDRKTASRERKCIIPMFELELCILTTNTLSKSLFFSNLLQKFNEKDYSKIVSSFPSSIFSFPFNIFFSSSNITHAHVTLAFLSYSPSSWITFLEDFKKNYKENPPRRYSLLYFISIWFQLRPKHFLKFLPILTDFVEEFDDGNLFIKHLKIILKQAEWNVNFMFLPLDGISPDFHLTYIQFSDKNKNIVGSNATSIQNSFKSNVIKKLDLKKKISDESPERSYQSNDLFNAIAICLLTIHNTLSFDCILYCNSSEDIQIDDEFGEDYNQYVDKMNSICLDEWLKYLRQKNSKLSELFTPNEFDFWRKKSNNIKIGSKELKKLIKIAEQGFSNWFVNLFNESKNDEIDIIFENYELIYENISQICPDLIDMIKIDTKLITNEAAKNKFHDDKYIRKENINNYRVLLSQEQLNYEFKEFDPAKKDYKQFQDRMEDISALFKKKLNLNSINLKIDEHTPTVNETNVPNGFSVDPYLIRIVFFNITQIIFSKTQNDGEQEFEFLV